MKYFVDYGHGGNDSGAIGINSVLEKNINKLVGERVVHHLQRHNQTVLVSRIEDFNPSLSDRVQAIKEFKCDLGISIHCNASKYTDPKGLETFTWGNGNRELQLAESVHNQLIKDKLYSVNRGIKQEQWHILSHDIPCILLELGFITNEGDKNLILNNIEKFAVSITKGLLGFYGISYNEEQQANKYIYKVQVGAYENEKYAIELAESLKKNGYPVIVKKEIV